MVVVVVNVVVVVVATCALFAFDQALLQNLMYEPNEMKTIESICEMIWKIKVVCVSVFNNTHENRKTRHALAWQNAVFTSVIDTAQAYF